MNKIILMGRLTAEPELKYLSKDTSMAIARYTLAVDRRFAKKDDKENSTDFIRCVAFSKAGEFASKYFHKGQRVLVEGRIQTGSYKNKDGQIVYTTDIIVEGQEFADGKQATTADPMAGFADSTDEDEIPF